MGKKSLQDVQTLLHDHTPLIRAAAVEALGTLGANAPVSVILQVLHDPHWDVRAAAAQTLGKPGICAPVEYLVNVLQSETDENVREALIRTLGKQGKRTPLKLLGDILQKDPNWMVRTAAAWALGQQRTTFSLSILLDCLRCDRDETVRAEAAIALGQSQQIRAKEHLKAALQDPEEEVRNAANCALHRLSRETYQLSLEQREQVLPQNFEGKELTFQTLTNFISDKKGAVIQAQWLNMLDPILLLSYIYQYEEESLQETIIQPIKQTTPVKSFIQAREEKNTAIQVAIQEAIKLREERRWLDLIIVSLGLTSEKEPQKPVRVVLSGMRCRRVRETDHLVIEHIKKTLEETVKEPSVYERSTDLSNLTVWYEPNPSFVCGAL